MDNKKIQAKQKDYQICLHTSFASSDFSIANSNPEFGEQRSKKKLYSVDSNWTKQTFQNQQQLCSKKIEKKSPQLNSFLKVIIKQNAEKSSSSKMKKQRSQCRIKKYIKCNQSKQEENTYSPKINNKNDILISMNSRTWLQNKNQTKQINLFENAHQFLQQKDKINKKINCRAQYSGIIQQTMMKSTENFNLFNQQDNLQRRNWSPNGKKMGNLILHKKNDSFKNIQKQIQFRYRVKKQHNTNNNLLIHSCQYPNISIDLAKVKKYSENQKYNCETPSPKRIKKQRQLKDNHQKPQFLIKKQQQLKLINAKSSESEILPERKEVALKVLNFSQNPRMIVLYILKHLASNDTTTTYLVIQKQTKSIFCLKKCFAKISSTQFQFLIREGKVGGKLNHPLLLKTYCTLYDDRNIYQLMEYMEGHTLYELSHAERTSIIKKKTYWSVNQDNSPHKCPSMSPSKINLADKVNNQGTTSERNCKLQSIRLILKGVLIALAYLHSEKVIHRDIKPSNIFVSYDYTFKVGDFGSCGFQGSKQYVGTLDYVAPQILLKKPYNNSVDMWSIGCLAYELYVGKPPFYDKDNDVTIKNIIQCSYDKSKIGDKSMLCFVFDLLQKNSSKRMTALQALDHPFIKNVSCNSQIIN